MPADRPRSSANRYLAEDEEIAVPAATSAAVSRYGAEWGTGRQAFVLAALFVLLHRHTAEPDLLVGLPTADVPIRIVLDPRRSFDDLVKAVHRGAGEAADNAGVAMAQVVSVLEPGRDLRRSPLVTATFTCLADQADSAAAANQADGADLKFFLRAAGDGLTVVLRYNTALFRRPTALRLLRHLLALLTQAAQNPGQPVAALALEDAAVPRREWALPTPEGYAAPAPLGDQESLPARLRAVAAASAADVAVCGPSGVYSYAELEAVTDAVAARLRRLVNPGGRIALLCEHDVGCVVGIWSVLKAHASYVPLDPRHPDGYLRQITAGTAVSAIACDIHLADRAAKIAAGKPVLLLEPGPVTDASPCDPPPSADDLAYVLYTSGSAGRPKGVMQTHGNVAAHALRYAQRLRIGPGDQIPLFARYTFDAAVMDLFGALLTGATLHILDPYEQDARTLWRCLSDRAVTVIHCTPTLFRHLIGAAAASPDMTPASVRVVALGGEEVAGSDLRDFLRVFPPSCAMVNGLGPTECTLALQHLVEPMDRERPTIPVGYPVDGIDVALVDADGQLAEVRGELVIRSSRVATGYWQQTALTAQAFGTGPDGTPYYRTGDLAYRLPNGALLFRGRKDQQVKIRGQRAEPAEAEALLRAHPTVGKAVVILDRSPDGRARLIGYVTSPTPMPVRPSELLGYLRRQLPDHLVPERVVVLDTLPVGPTGKLDRARLPPPPDEAEPALSDAPSTPRELALARVWCEVLGRQAVGIRDSFIGLGGDSLQVMELLGRLGETGIQMSLREFLTSPTIESIVRHQAAADQPAAGRQARA